MVLFPTTTLPVVKDIELPKSKEQLDCEVNGGTWDQTNLKCILPEPEPEPVNQEPEQIEEVKPATPEIIKDEETGKVTGVTFPDGKTFFGTPREINELVQARARKTTPPAGTLPAGTAQRLAEETRRKIAIARNVGQIDAFTASQLEEQGLNVREFLAAGAGGALRTAATFGATAGAAGLIAGPAAPVTVPAAAAIGGAIGLVKGFIFDVADNIKDQRKDLVSVKTKELKQRKTAMNNYIQAANMNPAQAEDYVLAYNIEKSLVLKDFNTLVKRGNEDLEFWGTDATRQIVEYEVFFESVQPSLDVRMEQAVLKPEPSRAFISLEEES